MPGWKSASTSFDHRSFRLNDEANLNVHDDGVAGKAHVVFFDDLAKSRCIPPAEWRNRAWLEKCTEDAASLSGFQL